MRRLMAGGVVAAWGLAAAGALLAQEPGTSKPATTVELTGCVSLNPGASGQFAFVDGTSGSTFRLRGKGIDRYAGRKVLLVADSSSKRLKVRFGLWPSPNLAGQAGDLDPAQESIARQPGGAASGSGANLPELRVVRLRGMDGSCG